MMLSDKFNNTFYAHVRRECRRYEIKLIVSTENAFFDDNESYGGYFDHETRELGVSKGDSEPDFISILVHEFSHMEQWIEEDPTYTHHLRGGYESSEIMDKWIKGREYEYNTIKSAIDIIRDCELNCERRAIKNIEKYNLNLDMDDYCRSSNAYIMFYNYIMKKRRWEYEKSASEIPEIVNAMPNDLYSLDYTKLSKKYKDLFDMYLK